MIGHPLIQLGATDRTLFAVAPGETFTVPTSVATTSPTSQYQPSGVAGTFNNTRQTAGGQLLLTISDAAGPSNVSDFSNEIFPGDVIAVGAIAGGKAPITINGVAVGSIPATTYASLVGVYG